jgi:hypothetical protein
MTDKTTPEAHARLSPSGAKKWFACPGSLTMEAPFPNKSSTHSDDGTAMHDVAARYLTEHTRASSYVGQWIKVSNKGEPDRKVQFDDDMADLTQGYVDYVRTLAIGHELYVEQKLEFSKFVGVPDQFGTTDAGIVNYDQGELMVIDLKTGHRPVDVSENVQLSVYALAMLGELYEQAMAAKAQEDDSDSLF